MTAKALQLKKSNTKTAYHVTRSGFTDLGPSSDSRTASPPTNGNEPISALHLLCQRAMNTVPIAFFCGGSESSRGHYALTERRTAVRPNFVARAFSNGLICPSTGLVDHGVVILPISASGHAAVVCESPPQRRERRREPSPRLST